MPKTAFAVVAHPDDIEFVMSGTMMLLADAGYDLHYMNVANGSCGSLQHDAETITRMRREESINAAKYLGAKYHESLANDLEVFYEKPTLMKLASVMREVEPEILLVHSPQDYMEDHMNSCRLAVTAAFVRGVPNFPVDPPREHTTRNVTVYHAQPHGNVDGLMNPIRPRMFVNVTGKMDRKAEMLSLHKSQKEWLDESQGMDSYTQVMADQCQEVGKLSVRFEFAEGWRKHSHLGFCGPEDDPLADALGDLAFIPA